jgi:transcriptional regulator with XRE-family HTH domain
MIDLPEIRRAAGRTQVELATALNTSQGQISRIERQSDLLLSTLRAYLTALGAEASLVVSVGGKTIAQELTEGRRR